MDTGIKEGTYITWEEFGGTKHQGFVKEMDSNMAVVDCEIHGKVCTCDNC